MSYVYDPENRLITENNTSGLSASYYYDGLGERVEKVLSNGQSVVYVYDAFGNLAEEYSPYNVWSKDNIWLGGQLLATDGANGNPCWTCFLSRDQVGTVRLMTDPSTNLITRHDYLPFGDEIPAGTAGRGSQFGPGADGLNQKFTGQYRDTETGLDFFNARYYAMAISRFLSPDPGNAGADPTDPQTWNAYAYVRNNPLSLTDPSGMNPFAPDPDDPNDPDAPWSCFDEFDIGQPCGWFSVPPVRFGGAGGGGGGGHSSQSSGTGNTPAATPPPFPPGSFPDGENLGLPPGMSVPGLWGVDTECDFGPCGILPGSSAQRIAISQTDAALIALAADFWKGIRIWINGRPAPGDPYEVRLFGTHWCGPGGAGPPVNGLDQACQAHDYCYDNRRLTVQDNFNPFLSSSKKTALQMCNQNLCNASRSVFTKSLGGAYVNGYFSYVGVARCH